MAEDGTQDPGPPPVMSDPLSGLVTGGRYEQEPLKVRVVEPPMPDISAVREAMAGMLDEDSELGIALAAQSTRTEAAEAPAEEVPDQAPQAEVIEEPTPTPPIGVQAQKPAEPAEVPAPRTPETPKTAKMVTPGTIEMPKRLSSRLRRPQSGDEPRPAAAVGRKSSAPSVAAIVVLLLVIGVIAVVLLSSLFDTFASIFS